MSNFIRRLAPEEAQERACIAEHVMINASGGRPVLDGSAEASMDYAAWCNQFGHALREYADAMQRMGSAYYRAAGAA